MSRAKQHRSPIMAAVHETAKDLNAAGLIAPMAVELIQGGRRMAEGRRKPGDAAGRPPVEDCHSPPVFR